MDHPIDMQSSERRVRTWGIVALLFVIALINYFDRQSLSVVAPRLQAALHLSDEGYGHVVSLFLFASACAYIATGFITDRLGTRKSMGVFVAVWSLAEAATAFVTSGIQLGVARFMLGLGEPGLWVAAPKTVAEVLPKPQRALAIGVYTMGATVGAVIAIPTIAAITARLPWRTIFLIDGLAGLLWLPLWFFFYRRTEAPPIQASLKGDSLSAVLTRGATWRLMIARGLTDPVWYFYLFWFPKYLIAERHLTLAQTARVGWIVYVGGGVGTLLGGLISGWCIRRGVKPAYAYRRVMLWMALVVPFSPIAHFFSSPLLAVCLCSVMAMAHMMWLINLTAMVIDIFPPHQIGKALGMVAMGSALGGMLSTELIASLVTHHGYQLVFFLMMFVHPLALALIWRLPE